MKNFTISTMSAPTVSITFNSWSPYPQLLNKKLELINRIGSSETIVQSLYTSSIPTQAMSVSFFATIGEVQAANIAMNRLPGIELKLVDAINQITITKLVISDLVTKVKKVAGGWILISEFSQFIKA